jgi:rubrerythrin
MSIIFSADDVFEMAEQIERNGSAFYKKASTLAKTESAKALFERLSNWELTHLHIFEEMHEEIRNGDIDQNVLDPDNEAGMYLTAMADGHVFDFKKIGPELIKDNENTPGIIRTALKIEKDSIIFYLGIKNMVITKTGSEKVVDIIGEEMKHIAFLNKELASIQ